MIEALVGLSALMLVNIGLAAFSYGKLYQKVNDLCQRHNELSHRLNRLESLLLNSLKGEGEEK